MTRGWPKALLPLAAALLAVWAALPLAVWWGFTDTADPAQVAGTWRFWGWGCVVAALVAALALALSRGRVVTLVYRAWGRFATAPAPLAVSALVVAFALLTLAMCLGVFAGNPHNVDGFAQLFHARILLSGRAWIEPPPELASFATLQMILGPERWYSQYPPGQPLVLAAGLALGAWWILIPLLAAALAWATWRVGRWCAGESAARLALVLLCVSPFAIAVAASEMSHLPAATLGMLAAAFATMSGGARGHWAALAAGAALGLCTAFRPLDAVAAAVPAAIIVWLAAPERRRAFTYVVAGGLVATLPTVIFNQLTTGSWRVFGYTVLWGSDHSLGFHPVPFGVPLTLARAVARSGFDLHQVNRYLFDAPLPILLVIAAAFVAGRRRLAERDAVPLAGIVALIAVLFAYWHRDVFYGPRFLFSAMPWFVLLTARSMQLLSGAGRGPGRVAAFAVAVALAIGVVAVTPQRLAAYRRSTPVFHLHPDRDARAAGLHNSVVVIPDGWGERLIARMWQLGVPVRLSTRLYAAIDACALELALTRAEADSLARASLPATLDSLAALGQSGYRSDATDDVNLRLPLGALDPACHAEIAVDRRGFIKFAPFLYLNTARLDGSVVWARDLGPRGNRALRDRYADRRFFRYAPPAPDRPPVFMPLEP